MREGVAWFALSFSRPTGSDIPAADGLDCKSSAGELSFLAVSSPCPSAEHRVSKPVPFDRDPRLSSDSSNALDLASCIGAIRFTVGSDRSTMIALEFWTLSSSKFKPRFQFPTDMPVSHLLESRSLSLLADLARDLDRENLFIVTLL
ncbi:hypothetical protein ABW21_db0203820 [Orbilia brochopaga]|nr:hypothetical protein ABW21_db0203820 [Drechslerella brochopaga]